MYNLSGIPPVPARNTPLVGTGVLLLVLIAIGLIVVSGGIKRGR
jgi:hypothetical protein